MLLNFKVKLMLKSLNALYGHVRNTLLWFFFYFILQTIIWITLAILILVYPQALFILFSVFFVLFAAISIYFALVTAKYAFKIKKMKDKLSILKK